MGAFALRYPPQNDQFSPFHPHMHGTGTPVPIGADNDDANRNQGELGPVLWRNEREQATGCSISVAGRWRRRVRCCRCCLCWWLCLRRCLWRRVLRRRRRCRAGLAVYPRRGAASLRAGRDETEVNTERFRIEQ